MATKLADIEVVEIDDYIDTLHNEVARLQQYNSKDTQWAVAKRRKFLQLIELLRLVRQDKQMRGMSGKRIDQEAIDAVPALKQQHALVLYFQTDEGRNAAAEILQDAFQEQRIVKTVKL